MWAPDVHKVAPISALSQNLFAFALVGVFAAGVYLIQAAPPAVSHSGWMLQVEKLRKGTDRSRVVVIAATESIPL